VQPSGCTFVFPPFVCNESSIVWHTFLRATIKAIKPTEKIVETDVGELQYTTLVIALGSGVNYFNTPGAAEHSYSVRTLDSAMRLRNGIITAFEQNTGPITINVVGGGYTGIETVGQLLHLANHDLKKLYPNRQTILKVIEAGPTILSNLLPVVQNTIKERLAARGVAFVLKSPVQTVSADSLTFNDGRTLPSSFTIWCAGVKNQAEKYLPSPYQEAGRIPVNGFLQSPHDASIYVVGDMARFCNSGSEVPVPQLGETAHSQGRYVGHHIATQLRQKKVRPFVFASLGSLIPVGDWYGVLILGNFTLFGALAWWIRRTTYLFFIPGFLRKLRIVFDWTLHSLGFRYIIDIEPKNN
jgi:NADH dehydrogenase